MPKMKKEKSDEISGLIEEGYTNVEIASKANVNEGTVSRMRSKLRKDGGEGSNVQARIESPAQPSFALSVESMKKLATIQVVLGCDTIEEAIDLLHKDVPKIMAVKFKAAPDFHGTPSEVFNEVVEASRLFSDATNTHNVDPELQAKVLAKMGMTWFVKGIYNLDKGVESLVQFMERKLIEHYEGKGWEFSRQSKAELESGQPELVGLVKGDIISIMREKPLTLIFPQIGEEYFGVHIGPLPIAMRSPNIERILKEDKK